MKKILSIVVLLMVVTCVFAGCELLENEFDYDVTVSLYVDGELYDTVPVKGNGRIEMPKAPEKENMIFVGWYVGDIFVREYDFSQPFLMDTSLTAHYVLDAVKITNLMTTETMKSVVTIEYLAYNGVYDPEEGDHATVQGSGVVIDISGGWGYVLTNAHVAAELDGFENHEMHVVDAWGNSFEAKVYSNPKKSQPAISSDYDLALLCFEYEIPEFDIMQEIPVSDGDPYVGEYVISLGTPMGQYNSITYGQVTSYKKVTVQNQGSFTRTDFDVIEHNAEILSGSSGGPLVDTNGKLVGLNFAAVNDGSIGCAIPLSQIHEFLSEYVYN